MSGHELTCTITALDQPPETVRAGGKLFVEIQADYDTTFILWLKTIPASERAYDPDSKRWYTTPAWLEEVCGWAKALFPKVWLVTDHGRSRRELVSGVEATQMDLFGGEA